MIGLACPKCHASALWIEATSDMDHLRVWSCHCCGATWFDRLPTFDTPLPPPPPPAGAFRSKFQAPREPRAKCHPGKAEYALGCCKACYMAQYMRQYRAANSLR